MGIVDNGLHHEFQIRFIGISYESFAVQRKYKVIFPA